MHNQSGFQHNQTDHQTQLVRPLFACAILRNLKFTPRSYASFIDLQDKLHQNIGRRRWLVAIGTHDLDKIEPPFRYEARDPEEIKFIPLAKKEAYTAKELMTVYEVFRHGDDTMNFHLITFLYRATSTLKSTSLSSGMHPFIQLYMTSRIAFSPSLLSSTPNTVK